MARNRSTSNLDIVVVAGLLAALPVDAHAYIDPGSGSLMLQLALSGVAGAVFMARRAIGRAFRALGGSRDLTQEFWSEDGHRSHREKHDD